MHNNIKNEFQRTLQRKPHSILTGSKNTIRRRRETDTAEGKINTDSHTTIVKKGSEKPTKQSHIEKANNIDKNCFVSPAVFTVKKKNKLKKLH